MKKLLFILFLIIVCIPAYSQKADTIIGSGNNIKAHVYYFHITNRCNTCRGIEAKTIKTLDSLFSEQFKNGTLVFSSYNCELKENESLVKKYDAYGATLAITIFKDGKEIKTEDLTNWAFEKTNKSDVFIIELSEKLHEILK